MYRRKIAYLFTYRNGIREQSVGILRQYGGAEAPEVTLELLRERERKEAWRIYYFNRRNLLAEATFLWETSIADPRSEVPTGFYRLCAEAGTGNGVLLLPEQEGTKRKAGIDWPNTDYYLCARFDGAEVKPPQVRAAFSRTGVGSREEECLQSAKKLVQEIAKAAEGSATEETPGKFVERNTPPRKRAEHNRIACLEELLIARPSYKPCKEASLLHSVRVLPEELTGLPKEGRQFADNSFLLHGYYHYKHLLLGRRRKKEQDDYVLLVPGIYQKKNAYLAGLFGFSEFLPAEMTGPENTGAKGMFGYWCAKI
ncbi:MAG: hypothetical protein IJW37_00830 [Lachnospiraceae bacterium]|nr:hypothetical protein [Lachnospiraceae bacterium]